MTPEQKLAEAERVIELMREALDTVSKDVYVFNEKRRQRLTVLTRKALTEADKFLKGDGV